MLCRHPLISPHARSVPEPTQPVNYCNHLHSIATMFSALNRNMPTIIKAKKSLSCSGRARGAMPGAWLPPKLRLLLLEQAHDEGLAPRPHAHRHIHKHHLPLVPLEQGEERGGGEAPLANQLKSGVMGGRELVRRGNKRAEARSSKTKAFPGFTHIQRSTQQFTLTMTSEAFSGPRSGNVTVAVWP